VNRAKYWILEEVEAAEKEVSSWPSWLIGAEAREQITKDSDQTLMTRRTQASEKA
jgi:hypothetical protein